MTAPHQRIPLADQETAEVTAIIPTERRHIPARQRVEARHLAAAGGDTFLAECRVLAEDRHTLGALTTREHWLSQHPVSEAMPLGMNGPEIVRVPSGSMEGLAHTVMYWPDHESYRCSCPAYGACHHIGAAHELLRQVRRASSGDGASAQQRYDDFADDLARRGY